MLNKFFYAALILIILAIIIFTQKHYNINNNERENIKTVFVESLEYQPQKLRNTSKDIDCISFIETPIGSFEKKKAVEIIDFLNELQNDYVSEDIIDMISLNSGIGLFNGRKLRHNFTIEYDKFPYYIGTLVKASKKEHEYLELLLNLNNTSKIIKAIEDQKVETQSLYQGKRHLVSLLGYFMESNFPEKNIIINKILHIHEEIFFSDIVIATKENLPIDIINKLYEQSNHSASKTFGERLVRHSLSTLALELGNYKLFKFWHEHGSSLTPDPFAPSPLDILIKNIDKFNKKEVNDLFKIFAKFNIKIRNKKTLSALNFILSKDDILQYKNILNITTHKVKFNEMKTAIILIDKLHAIILDGIVSFDLNGKEKHSCFNTLGRLITYNIFNYIKKTDSLYTPKQVKKNKIIKKTIKLYDKTEEIESHLNQYNGLDRKYLSLEYRKDNISRLIEKHDIDQTINGDISITLSEIYRLAQLEQWDKAINLANDKIINTQEAINTLLIIAFSTDAEFEIIQRLIDKGAELPQNLMFSLIAKDNIELTIKLKDYGIKLNFVDPLGNTSLMLAVKYKAFKMFNYLIEQGISINNTKDEFDALDIALIEYLPNDTYYIEQLLIHGAEIKLSHKQLAKKIKQDDLPGYMQLLKISQGFVTK